MPVFRIFAVTLLIAASTLAQQGGPGRGATLTHVHLNAADTDAAVAFWKDVIGTATYSREGIQGVSTQGALFFFTKKAPSGPSTGSTIDHIAMHVPDLQIIGDRLAKTHYKSFKPAGSDGILMIDGIDGIRIELVEDSAMYTPLELHHIHFFSKAPGETQAWYGKYFGARAGTDDQANTSRLAGGTLQFSAAPEAPAGTAGRVIDHLSFEVRDLQAFCAPLIAAGVKFDAPFDPAAPAKTGPVFLTDPWGTRIELTTPVLQ